MGGFWGFGPFWPILGGLDPPQGGPPGPAQAKAWATPGAFGTIGKSRGTFSAARRKFLTLPGGGSPGLAKKGPTLGVPPGGGPFFSYLQEGGHFRGVRATPGAFWALSGRVLGGPGPPGGGPRGGPGGPGVGPWGAQIWGFRGFGVGGSGSHFVTILEGSQRGCFGPLGGPEGHTRCLWDTKLGPRLIFWGKKNIRSLGIPLFSAQKGLPGPPPGGP